MKKLLRSQFLLSNNNDLSYNRCQSRSQSSSDDVIWPPKSHNCVNYYCDLVSEKVVTEDVQERDVVDKSTNSIIVDDFIGALEANEVITASDKIYAIHEEKNESMVVGETTSVETPHNVITVNNSQEQLPEAKNNELLVSEMEQKLEEMVSAVHFKEVNVDVEKKEEIYVNLGVVMSKENDVGFQAITFGEQIVVNAQSIVERFITKIFSKLLHMTDSSLQYKEPYIYALVKEVVEAFQSFYVRKKLMKVLSIPFDKGKRSAHYLSSTTSSVETKDVVELINLGAKELQSCKKPVGFVFPVNDENPQPFEGFKLDKICITFVIISIDDIMEKQQKLSEVQENLIQQQAQMKAPMARYHGELAQKKMQNEYEAHEQQNVESVTMQEESTLRREQARHYAEEYIQAQQCQIEKEQADMKREMIRLKVTAEATFLANETKITEDYNKRILLECRNGERE